MNTIALIETFSQVVLQRNFTAAAKAMHLSVAAVSKQIHHLENELGVLLFTRTTRKITLTSIGEVYYREVQKILLSLEHAQAVIAASRAAPAGLLRVKSARFFAEKIIIPQMPAFQKNYPHVTLDLQIAEDVPNLLEEGLDVVFGMSMAIASNSIQKKITTTRYVFCASPAYLTTHGHPQTVFDLQTHHYLTHSMRQPNNRWIFPTGETVYLQPSLYLNDAAAVAECACRGMGIAALHFYQVAEALEKGELVEILPQKRMPDIPVFLYYHPTRFMQPKLQCWIDSMTQDMPPFM